MLIECNRDELLRQAEEIRAKVEQAELNFRRKKISFTVSLGAVLYPDCGRDSLKLTNTADELLYKAKREGKNKVCFAG